jgi:hypothetical protein
MTPFVNDAMPYEQSTQSDDLHDTVHQIKPVLRQYVRSCASFRSIYHEDLFVGMQILGLVS